MAIIKERLYTVESLMAYVDERIRVYIQKQETFSPEDNDYKLRQTTKEFLRSCHQGDESDKLYVKQMMRRMITTPNGAEAADFPADYMVDETNINRFLDWSHPETLNAHVMFLTILYRYKETHGADALGAIIERYGLNNLRPRGEEGVGFYIDENDIRHIWSSEGFHPSYEERLEVLLQLIYEETRGNSCIDELLYQNIGDISAGVSGIPSGVSIQASEYDLPAYQTCWIRYKDCSIHLMFMSFGSNEKLKTVAKQIVDFEMKGQFSEKDGFKLGYGKDGSRRTAAIEPFGESPALWVRKFTAQSASNEELFSGVNGSQRVMDIERALVRGGATIPICGPQGSGKTTKLESIAQYIQNYFSVRVLETEFEARLRWKYPLKNIYTMEANETTPVTPPMAYNFSLRSAGDIYIIGEARSDDMIINVTRTANRGGRAVLFTFHPKTAAMTIPEIANALIREKMYTSLKDAVATALNTVRVCIFVTADIETHKHYYEVYEFVPKPNIIPNDFLKANDEETMQREFMKSIHAYMQTMASADTYFETVPIVTYDRNAKSYVVRNPISDSLYEELMSKTPREEERVELMRVFRPMEFVKRVLGENVTPSDRRIHDVVRAYGLEPALIFGNRS